MGAIANFLTITYLPLFNLIIPHIFVSASYIISQLVLNVRTNIVLRQFRHGYLQLKRSLILSQAVEWAVK